MIKNKLNWQNITIGDLISLQRGYDLTHKERSIGTVPVFGAAGHNGYHNVSRVNGPGIVLGRSGGSFGQVHICKEDFWPHNTGLFIKDFKGNDIFFVYYFLKNLDFSNLNSGSAQPSLNRNFVYPVKIKVPFYEEQKKIAKVLSDLDAKIELNNKINTELEAMAKLIYDYWFVQFDFPDKNGKPFKSAGGKMVYNEELKREIPEGWEVLNLSSLLNHNYESLGKNSPIKNIEYLDTSSLTKNVIEDTQSLNRDTDKIPSRAQRKVNPNDILYSTVRPNLCHYGIIKHPKNNMIASTGFVQLTSKSEDISNDLFYIYLTSDWVTDRLQQIAALSVSSYPSISPNDLLQLKNVLPKKREKLEFINSKFGTIYNKVSTNQKENQKLSELRDWLLPMLMNGQVQVK